MDETRLDKCRLDYYGGRWEASNPFLGFATLVDEGLYLTFTFTFTSTLQLQFGHCWFVEILRLIGKP